MDACKQTQMGGMCVYTGIPLGMCNTDMYAYKLIQIGWRIRIR